MKLVKLNRGPVSNKVSIGTLTGTITLGLTWALTYFIPAWHHGIPTALQPLIPGFAGVLAGFVGGYLAHHRATTAELAVAVKDAEDLLGLLGKVPTKSDPPPVRDSSPAGGGST